MKTGLLLILLPALGADRLDVLDVCSALRDRMQLNGQIVTIRGIAHGTSIGPFKPCEHPVVSSGVTWPDLVFVRYPAGQSEPARDRAAFDPDWSSIAAAERYAKKMHFSVSRDVQVVTYVGKFVTHADLGVLGAIVPTGTQAHELGYGPLGEAPAQLLLKSIRTVEIVKGAKAPPVQPRKVDPIKR